MLTDTEREKLRADLARAEHLAREHARILAGCRSALAGPPVDMLADPLAMFRLPSGAVGYETTYADQVAVGDWIQRCHGDPGWHLVEDQEDYPGPDGTPWVRLTYRGTAHDWKGTDAIRCARPPADTVAAQEQRWT